MKTTITTPWGKAAAVEQVNVAQRAGERRFATVVELLETADGERLVRFAYTTGGSVRRGPVTLRARISSGCRSCSSAHPSCERRSADERQEPLGVRSR